MTIASQTALLVAAIGNIGPATKDTFFAKKGGELVGPVWTKPFPVAFSATPVFDATKSNVFYFATLGATAVTASSFIGGTDGQTINVRILQDAVGGRAFPLPGNVVAKGALDTAPDAVNWLVLTWNVGATRWEAIWS
ncbi:hypothetical protein D3C71_79680 [compost metagenome]